MRIVNGMRPKIISMRDYDRFITEVEECISTHKVIDISYIRSDGSQNKYLTAFIPL